MENKKIPINEYRDNLAVKLKGARELDKGLAQEYLEKTQKTEEYQDTRVKKIDTHKKEEKQNAINKLKGEIGQIEMKADTSLLINEVKNAGLEKMGAVEKIVFEKLSALVNSSDTIEDKAVFTKMLRRLNGIKRFIKETRTQFSENAKYSPTIENMIKYGGQGGHGEAYKEDFFLDTLKNGENSIHPETSISFDDLNYKQEAKLLETFGFGIGKRFGDIIDEYNRQHKSLFKGPLKTSKKHVLNIPTNVDGLFINSTNYGLRDEPSSHFKSLVLGKKYIEEVFEEQIQ